jgi:hypothetical protein
VPQQQHFKISNKSLYGKIEQKGGYPMEVKVPISTEEIIGAVKKMKKRERDMFIEDLLAVTSPEYPESVREARADYKAGRTKSHKDIFGE